MTDKHREATSLETRVVELTHTIDPGFVNRRLIGTQIGEELQEAADWAIANLPSNLPDGLKEVRIDHIYAQIMQDVCREVEAKTLGGLLSSGSGHLFCSTQYLEAVPDVREHARIQSVVQTPGNADLKVILEFGTEHVRSDTLRMELSQGANLAVIALFRRKIGNTLYFQPLVMGGSWMSHEDESQSSWAMFAALDHFENYIEDFEEFSLVRDLPRPTDFSVMEKISEAAFKTCLALILGDRTRKDWGGEMSDHYTTSLTIGDRRCSGAFLLKGPSRFAEMGLNHLGKNNDQIFRLSQEPVDVLFVQHCHDIGAAVSATLRAFAVQPGRPRRYCLIDGKDSLRLLLAYDLLDMAVKLSKKKRPKS